MNAIAQQIDYATDELRMLNRVLEARDEYRRLADSAAKSRSKFGSVADDMAMQALYKLTRLERDYRDNYAPVEVIEDTPDVEPMEWKTDETFPQRQPRMTADERADDPRRGQGDRRTV